MIGNRLKLLRTEKGLSQEEVSSVLNITRQAYSSWERGEFEPSLEMINKIADYFKVTVDFLIERTNIRESIYEDPKLQEYINDCVKVYKKHVKDHD